MSVGSKVKGFFWTAVVLVGILAVGSWMINANPSNPAKKNATEQGVLVRVDWDPYFNRYWVLVDVYINGHKEGDTDPYQHSPFNKVYIVGKGSTVRVIARQEDGGTLACKIFRNGVPVEPQPKGQSHGPTTVMCQG